MRFLLIALLSFSLVSCANNNTKEVDLNPVESEPKVDFKKAALLNVEMGEAYLAQGQVTRAKQKFIHALELKPKLPEAHTSIGFFYEKVGDLKEAEYHYKEAINYAVGSKGRFYNNYGTFLCRQSRYSEADRAFNSAINDKQYIDTAAVYENAGLCSLKEANLEKAQAYFKTAVTRDPRRAIANLELASMELEKHNYLVAKDYLNNYKHNSEPSARSLLLGIKINKVVGDKNEMASDELKLRNMFPDSQECKQYLGSIAHE